MLYLVEIYVGSVIIALLMNYNLKSHGLKGISWANCFNPIKIIGVAIGFTLSYMFPLHIFEQYILRFYDVDCRAECLIGNEGKCVSCGCNTRAKMWSPFESCSKNRWAKIIWSRKKYKEYRLKYPVQIKTQYGII